LLVNTRSLKGAEWYEEAKQKLADKGVVLTFSGQYSKANDLFARASEEAGSGRLVIVGGGDGTISGVVNIFAKTDTTLAVLPLGTGNAFARDLGIETDLDSAISTIVEGAECEVDLGLCGDRYFVNVATMGLTADMARTINVPLKRRFGRYVYAIALAKALQNMQSFQARIETENGGREVNAIQLVIGNGRYHGGPLPLSLTAAITSGALRLYAVEAGSKASLLKYALLLPTGLQGLLKEVYSESTTGGIITTDPVRPVVVDGEIAAETPIQFAVAPLALRVMAPLAFKG
jgi:YegS/Rv2252/BmrU family lipid kinase